jgi:hypothetical protein
MKNIRLVSILVAALMTAAAGFAADSEVTLVGDGQCAKCSLGQSPQCANALVVKQDGKEITYFLTDNKVSKDFHDTICTEVAQIKVTGVVTEKSGRKEIVASKIELVKKS